MHVIKGMVGCLRLGNVNVCEGGQKNPLHVILTVERRRWWHTAKLTGLKCGKVKATFAEELN